MLHKYYFFIICSLYRYDFYINIFKNFCLETCSPQLKNDKNGAAMSRKKMDEVKQEQVDSSNVVSQEDIKKLPLELNNSDVTGSNEAHTKEIDADEISINDSVNASPDNGHKNIIDNKENTKEFENDKTVDAPIANNNTDNTIIKAQNKKIEELNNLDFDVDFECNEESKESNEDLDDEKMIINVSNSIEDKEMEIVPKTIDDEDNIQDEELDHEVDEEEIKSTNAEFNQTNETVCLVFNF